jgi:putative endonuclease
MYHTYILYSEKIQKYYTGQTANLANRLQEHNQGETPSIKISIPWVIIWSHPSQTRQEAMKLEKKIKARGAQRFIQDLKR